MLPWLCAEQKPSRGQLSALHDQVKPAKMHPKSTMALLLLKHSREQKSLRVLNGHMPGIS